MLHWPFLTMLHWVALMIYPDIIIMCALIFPCNFRFSNSRCWYPSMFTYNLPPHTTPHSHTIKMWAFLTFPLGFTTDKTIEATIHRKGSRCSQVFNVFSGGFFCFGVLDYSVSSSLQFSFVYPPRHTESPRRVNFNSQSQAIRWPAWPICHSILFLLPFLFVSPFIYHVMYIMHGFSVNNKCVLKMLQDRIKRKEQACQ